MIHFSFDHIRSWEDQDGNGYHLELYDTYQTDHSKSVLAYEFFHNGELIFEGTDFCPAPSQAIDSDMVVGGLLAFLSLQPGDTDREYFRGYTKRQMEFAREEGENLSLYVEQLEG